MNRITIQEMYQRQVNQRFCVLPPTSTYLGIMDKVQWNVACRRIAGTPLTDKLPTNCCSS